MNSKNDLGWVCALFCMSYFWFLLSWHRRDTTRDRLQELGLAIVFLSMIGWLMSMTQSSTSLACSLIGIATMVAAGSRLVKPRFLGTYVIAGLLIALAANAAFDIY